MLLLGPLPRAKVYPPAGFCIYCGNTDPPLTLEHIVPYSLEGDLELPAASCPSCQKATWWAENTCIGEMFLAPRTHLRVRTRNPSRRPKTLPMGVYDTPPPGESPPIDMGSANFHWREMPIEDHPSTIILPQLPEAGIFSGKSYPGSMDVVGLQIHVLRPAPEPAPGESHGTFHPFTTEAFPRMLAKIAHGLAVAELGRDAFVPLLPDFILRRRRDYDNVMETTSFGRGTKDRLVYCSLLFDRGFIAVRIQIFAQFGFKPYQVIVGPPTAEGYLYSARMASTQTL